MPLRPSGFILTLAAALILCSMVTHSGAETEIRIGGTGSGLGVMKNLAAEFKKSHPGITIRFMPSLGSSGGIKALLNGALDVAISGRTLKADEEKGGAVAVEAAKTPFIFIANNSVSISDITTRELEMIYSGQLQRWPDGSRIRLILRPLGDTDSKIVKSISGKMVGALETALERQDMVVAVTDQEAVESVARIPGAIGGATLSQVISEQQPVHILSLNGVKPALNTLVSGTYPLSKPLYLVTTAHTSPAARQFIQFVRSSRGSTILLASDAQPAGTFKKAP